MRLLRVHSYKFVEYASEREVPQYGILSHRWHDDEVTYNDMLDGHAQKRKGWTKIRAFCQRCAEDGLSLAWVDTCCIDKSSSAELSEAINSMYRWYQEACKCYVFLADVTGPRAVATRAQIGRARPEWLESEWFERGWALQELIAPSEVHIYDRAWQEIGNKRQLSDLISSVTRIPADVLHGERPSNYCVAQRMSWAAKRKTSRIEDQAYCLMGLFEVNMPLLYGEGERAFRRLQEEIIRYSDDLSIFAWPGYISGYDESELYDVVYRRLEGLLAVAPGAFALCGDVVWNPHQTSQEQARKPHLMTNLGLEIEMSLRVYHLELYEAKLNCTQRDRSMSIFLRQTNQDGQYIRVVRESSLTGNWFDGNSEGLVRRIYVLQSRPQQAIKSATATMLITKNDDVFQHVLRYQGQFFHSRHNAVWTLSLGRFLHGNTAASFAFKAGHHAEYVLTIGVQFDFDFNPYLEFAQEYRNSNLQQHENEDPAPGEVAGEPLPIALFGNREVVIDVRAFSQRKIVHRAHRVSGLLLWLKQYNLMINLQKQSIISDEIWTLEMQRADLSIPHTLVCNCAVPCFSCTLSKELSPTELYQDLAEVVASEYKCVICQGFLARPITSACGHTFCQSCISWAGLSLTSCQMTSSALTLQTMFGKSRCPICLQTAKFAINWNLQQELWQRCPISYRRAAWGFDTPDKEKFPAYDFLILAIGNTHKITPVSPENQLDPAGVSNRHDWTFFVRPSGLDCVAEVKVFLHPTFRQSEITITGEPYEIRRFGWGTFVIRAEVTLKPSFRYLHEKAVLTKGTQSTLEFEWELSFDGDGGQGSLKVLVERSKRQLSGSDRKVQEQIKNLRTLQQAASLSG